MVFTLWMNSINQSKYPLLATYKKPHLPARDLGCDSKICGCISYAFYIKSIAGLRAYCHNSIQIIIQLQQKQDFFQLKQSKLMYTKKELNLMNIFFYNKSSFRRIYGCAIGSDI